MRLYKYLFYRIYDWDLHTFGLKHRSEWSALFYSYLVMALNILTIIAVFQDLGMINIFNTKNGKTVIMIFAGILWVSGYSWLIKDRKYMKLAEKYRNEPKKKRSRNAILLWLYGILSFVVPTLIAYFH